MICVSQHEEDILDDAGKVCLEETIADAWICTREIIHDFQADWKDISCIGGE